MKKKVAGVVLVFITCSLILVNANKEKNNHIIENEKSNNIINTNALTMMYETDYDSGEYQVSSDNTWPTDGYIFNSKLSSCENGSKLTWDNESKRIIMQANTSDKCYVYFDKYNTIEITNITTSKTTNSITLSAIITEGSNPAEMYYFTINDGDSWETSPTNSYTYNNLNPNTEYNFRVYAVDTQGFNSNEYTLSETTNTYINPTVNGITTTEVTHNSISISVSASSGTNNISNYYYSINNKSYVSSTSNTYTFSNLNANTQYTIRVYVTDTNNVSSNTYTTNINTAILDIPVINSASMGYYDCDGSQISYINMNVTTNSDIVAAYLTVNGRGPTSGHNITNSRFEFYAGNVPTDFGNDIPFTIYVVNSAGFTSEIYSGTFDVNPGTCFVAGTKVKTYNGFKNIEDIKEGELVYSFNELTKKVELNKVTNTFIHEDSIIYEIKLDNEIIKVTPNHRFYIKRNNKYQWIIAKEILESDKLIDINNKEIDIIDIKTYKEKNTVYNIEVASNHNYYITENNILVHNIKGPCLVPVQ